MDPFDLLVQRLCDVLGSRRDSALAHLQTIRSEAFQDSIDTVRRIAAEVRAETDPQDPDDPVTTDSE